VQPEVHVLARAHRPERVRGGDAGRGRLLRRGGRLRLSAHVLYALADADPAVATKRFRLLARRRR
jgi:hypothetical protein